MSIKNVNVEDTPRGEKLNKVLIEEKVQLLIGDESKYQEIAYLVDRPEFF